MFIWLTNPTAGQVLVNLDHVTFITSIPGMPSALGKNSVYFTGGKGDYIVVTESLEDIYERIQSAEIDEFEGKVKEWTLRKKTNEET